jgi:hypothetical protein
MHSSLLLALWAGASYILYKLATVALSEYTHRKREYANGCQRPPSVQGADPIGIENIRRLLKSDKECRMPDYLKERTEAACEKEGKLLTTFYQNVLGSPAIFTTDPKNIQTILATQFKDFGLGETRNNNFFPLLGWGIVSGRSISDN